MTDAIETRGATRSELLYRKLVAEAREQRWEQALESALERVAVERELLARQTDGQLETEADDEQPPL
jgi:hypothetical protein